MDEWGISGLRVSSKMISCEYIIVIILQTLYFFVYFCLLLRYFRSFSDEPWEMNVEKCAMNKSKNVGLVGEIVTSTWNTTTSVWKKHYVAHTHVFDPKENNTKSKVEVIFIRFLNVRDIIHNKFFSKGQTINHQVCNDILQRMLCSVREKRYKW